MDTRGGDVDRQRQSQGIDEQVAFPPLDALVGIVAADASGFLDGLNALCVHDRRRPVRMPAHAPSLRHPECHEGTVPHAAEAEAPEVVVDGLPGREITGKIAPRASRTQEIEDGFEDPAERVPRASPARHGRRQVTLQAFPFRIGQVGGVRDVHAQERTRSPVLSHHQTRSKTPALPLALIHELSGRGVLGSLSDGAVRLCAPCAYTSLATTTNGRGRWAIGTTSSWPRREPPESLPGWCSSESPSTWRRSCLSRPSA